MDADWSAELAADDAALEFPWSSPDGSMHYVDLLRSPDLLTAVPEAKQFTELGEFLVAINGSTSPWLTAKCDVWADDELSEAEGIYQASRKLSSYVDLILREHDARFSFHRHELWVKAVAKELSTDDEPHAACEFIVRRCWYNTQADPMRTEDDEETPAEEHTISGFYVTFYLSGYGDDESQTRARWAAGLRRVTAVLTRLAA